MLNIKKYFHLSWRQKLALLALVALIAVSQIGHAPAQTVVQGYASDSSLQRGMLVSLDKTDATKVAATTNSSLDRLRGLVVDPSDAAVTLSSANQKVLVASAGRFVALVSNQNGTVKPNDYVSISSLPGIGMKARTDQSTVVGRAVTGFDGSTNVVSTATVQDNGTSRQTAIGKIDVDISVMPNPQAGNTTSNVPNFLQSFTNSVAGKPVSPGKVYVAAAVVLITGIISGSMLYAGVRSSIVAIGRNPLSRKSIMGGLLQVLITSLIIFIGGLFAVYLLLKL